jgi:predicted  nucleic acid-binding Zn-ribbon protein
MHPDLERIIHLQRLEDIAEQARRALADEPLRQLALTDMLAAAQKSLDEERARLAQNQAVRRDIEKELAMQQGRLSKFKGQLMEVKTNREYQAMQKEIEVAQHEIQKQEDQLLERMLEFDEITRQVKQAESGFARDKAAVQEQRTALAAQLAAAQATLSKVAADRESLVPTISAPVMAMFERVLKYRKVSAVVSIKEGRCGSCQVRLRPQTVNELRKNEIIFQCESCQRILYYEAGTAPVAVDRPVAIDPHGD